MTYPERVRRGALIALVAMLIATVVGGIMAGAGYATGYMAGFAALGSAACIVVLAVTKSKVDKQERASDTRARTHV